MKISNQMNMIHLKKGTLKIQQPHLLKAIIGTGILSLPCAFRSCGLGLGILSTIVISFMSSYCAHTLVQSAHILYYKTKKSQMSYADVAETALSVGPTALKKFGKTARYVVDVGLFVSHFGTCTAYIVIVAKNIKDVLDYHQGGDHADVRVIIIILLLPLLFLTWIPDLKYLAPVSIIANIFMLTSLLTIFYWLTKDLITSDKIVRDGFNWIGIDETNDISWYSKYSQTFSIIIFSVGSIGIVMPLENKMKSPKNFVGPLGVLSQGTILFTFIYMTIGILGYLYNPKATEPIITLEMPMNADYWNSLMAQAVRILIALSVFCSFCLQFFISLGVSWIWIKDRFSKNKIIANYGLRISLVLSNVFLAIVFPDVLLLLNFVGGFGGSILGLFIPVLIETMTHWDDDSHWRILRHLKNLVIMFVAILAFYFATADSIRDIKNKFIQGKE
ncbi:proton-coupled amino acid transporter-like protein pathetic isoform X2 [Aphidius gifuensis]|uniref:proton-coupled amino acid transporter-like protein pathetic isoform X2 n=1 Tax=Aphidius gifuensis TaxID=684658 RepID=UPI001CDC7930|nr:proton-coupled amino acid transporter-like protein pathetic isoform X2 [Aphidius gifuensis]